LFKLIQFLFSPDCPEVSGGNPFFNSDRVLNSVGVEKRLKRKAGIAIVENARAVRSKLIFISKFEMLKQVQH